MTIAVCYNCGTLKFGAFNPCTKCGERPTNEDALAVSLALTDHYSDENTLKQYGAGISAGGTPTLDPSVRENIIGMIRKFGLLDSAVCPSQDVPETSASSAKTTQEKAQMLVQVANWTAINFYKSMADDFPELRGFKKIDDWDFFLTAAIVASAIFHLQMALGADQVESIQIEIAEQIIGIYPKAWDAIFHLIKFINTEKKPVMPSGELTDRKVAKVLNEIHEKMEASIGSWVVLNLKGNAPDESDCPLVSAIGRFCYGHNCEELIAGFIQEDDSCTEETSKRDVQMLQIRPAQQQKLETAFWRGEALLSRLIELTNRTVKESGWRCIFRNFPFAEVAEQAREIEQEIQGFKDWIEHEIIAEIPDGATHGPDVNAINALFDWVLAIHRAAQLMSRKQQVFKEESEGARKLTLSETVRLNAEYDRAQVDYSELGERLQDAMENLRAAQATEGHGE